MPQAQLLTPINFSSSDMNQSPNVINTRMTSATTEYGEVQNEESQQLKDFYGDKKDVAPPLAPIAPMSPGKKLLYYAGSPGRFI